MLDLVIKAAGDVVLDAAVRAAGRLRRWRTTILAAAGVVLLTVSLIVIGVAGDRSDELRAHGGRTPGVVVSVEDASSGSVRVAYTVGIRRFTEHLDLGDYASDARIGRRVTVYYDNADPSSMTADDVDNMSETAVTLACVTLVLGLFGCLAAGCTAWRARRTTRRERHAAQPAAATILQK